MTFMISRLVFDLFKEARSDPGFKYEPATKVHPSYNSIPTTWIEAILSSFIHPWGCNGKYIPRDVYP